MASKCVERTRLRPDTRLVLIARVAHPPLARRAAQSNREALDAVAAGVRLSTDVWVSHITVPELTAE